MLYTYKSSTFYRNPPPFSVLAVTSQTWAERAKRPASTLSARHDH